MARFRPAKGLEASVARKIVAPAIRQAQSAGAQASKDSAPPGKQWQSQVSGSDRRETHLHAHGQVVPDNLRFWIESEDWDVRHGRAEEHQFARKPRDKNLTAGSSLNCECQVRTVDDEVSKHIAEKSVSVSGAVVSGGWTCDHKLSENANFGNSEDDPAGFMGAGLREARKRFK